MTFYLIILLSVLEIYLYNDLMKISTNFEKYYIGIEVAEDATINDIQSYLIEHTDLLKSSNLLYDLRAFNFQSVSLEEIQNYIKNIADFLQKRVAKKTALLVDSEEGMIITRVFKHSSKDQNNAVMDIFFDKDKAINWLSEE